MNIKNRCGWCAQDTLLIEYHDNEWGKPLHDDRSLFEMLTLEGAQAGLSWLTVLKRRSSYRELFYNFNIEKVARMDDAQLEKILLNPAIIRNRLKVFSVRDNALAALKLIEEFDSFAQYLWSWVNHTPIINNWKCASEVPTTTPLAEHISKDLYSRGFCFIGPTITYAFMQAIGMVNDHLVDCFVQCG